MPYVTVGQENSATINLYYEDLGQVNRLFSFMDFPSTVILGKSRS